MGGFFGGGGGGGQQDMGPMYIPYEMMAPSYSMYTQLPTLGYGQSLLSGDSQLGGRPATTGDVNYASDSTSQVPGSAQALLSRNANRSPISAWG